MIWMERKKCLWTCLSLGNMAHNFCLHHFLPFLLVATNTPINLVWRNTSWELRCCFTAAPSVWVTNIFLDCSKAFFYFLLFQQRKSKHNKQKLWTKAKKKKDKKYMWRKRGSLVYKCINTQEKIQIIIIINWRFSWFLFYSLLQQSKDR